MIDELRKHVDDLRTELPTLKTETTDLITSVLSEYQQSFVEVVESKVEGMKAETELATGKLAKELKAVEATSGTALDQATKVVEKLKKFKLAIKDDMKKQL